MHFLRRRPETRALPIVLLGRSPSGDVVRWAYMSGANSYVVLPQNAELLAERLRDLIAYWMEFNRSPSP
jgi:CheY-like chemotaxis protein